MSKLTSRFWAVVAVLTLGVCAAFAQGDPSAKFAAAWDNSLLIAETVAESCDPALTNPLLDPSDPAAVFDFDSASDVVMATMKMSQGKEILAGISAESKILLQTNVKGKLGGSSTAAGYGKVAVRIYAKNVDTGERFPPVPNGRIVLNARYQQLDATLGGVIESCTDENTDGTIDVATECVISPEEIGLLTSNQSANSFNVVFVDLPQGTYKIKARFTVLSSSFADATENACAYAHSKVVLGDRIVTLQDVRAVKGSIEPVEIQ
jgi:hypothetical protein